MRATLNIRLYRAYGIGADAGYAADKAVGMCLAIKAAAGLPHGDTADTTPTAVCFYVGTGALATYGSSGADPDNNGFKVKNADNMYSLDLLKPSLVTAGAVVTSGVAGPSADSNVLKASAAANSATFGKLKIAFTGPAKNTNCLGFFMGGGDCLLTASWYLSKVKK